MKYSLACDSWDEKEYKAINRVISSGNFSMGKEVIKMEEKFAEFFGAQYCVMSNSGSSANLIGIAALIFSKKLSKGDEVIVPAVSWSTTYFPLQQYGLKVKFVDIDLETLNFDLNALSSAINKKTKMILAVNLLGNNNDFDKIKKLIEDKDIILFEDNCESMGSEYNNKKSGTFGIIGTYSSFFSHHIATMEGGYSVTDDFELYEFMKVVRAHGWTRNISKDSTLYKKSDDDFYEKYNFILPGYNLRPLEIEAAIGIEQIDKINDIVDFRRKNAELFIAKIGSIPNLLLQKEVGKSSWFGFSILLINSLKGKRTEIIRVLEANEVEVRPIVTGNFVKNKAIEYFDYSIHKSLKNADYIHEHGFFVGNNGKDLSIEINHLYKILIEHIGLN
jgi:CDP-4-dehydro-6-deoxyglucose reductase, E1